MEDISGALLPYLFPVPAITNDHNLYNDTDEGFKMTQIYYTTVLEVKSPKCISLD